MRIILLVLFLTGCGHATVVTKPAPRTIPTEPFVIERDKYNSINMYRLRTPAGWIVQLEGMSFYVPDSEHEGLKN